MIENLHEEKVICMVCGRRHFPDEVTYLTFYGNITFGVGGGIVGNNFDENWKLQRVQYICHSEGCFRKLFFPQFVREI